MKRTRYHHWAFRLGCWGVIFFVALATYSCLTPPPPLATPDRETVVLLHGLNGSHRAMTRLAGALSDEGYAVINCDYPSRSADRRIQTSPLLVSSLHTHKTLIRTAMRCNRLVSGV